MWSRSQAQSRPRIIYHRAEDPCSSASSLGLWASWHFCLDTKVNTFIFNKLPVTVTVTVFRTRRQRSIIAGPGTCISKAWNSGNESGLECHFRTTTSTSRPASWRSFGHQTDAMNIRFPKWTFAIERTTGAASLCSIRDWTVLLTTGTGLSHVVNLTQFSFLVWQVMNLELHNHGGDSMVWNWFDTTALNCWETAHTPREKNIKNKMDIHF